MAPSKTANYIQWKGYDAAAAITRFRAVKFSAAETVTPVTSKADVIAGVAQFDVTTDEIAAGKGASIAVEGDTLIECNAATTLGGPAGLNADGTAHDAATGDRIIGHFVEAASGAGDWARVHLNTDGALAA